MKLTDELLLAIQSGRKTRAALLSEIRMSESVFDDVAAELGPKVFWMGSGDSRVLLSRRAVRGAYLSFPLYFIDRQGQDRLCALLHPLSPSGYVVEVLEDIPWPSDESGNLSTDGLPYFLYDLVPEGFMGGNFGRFFGKHLDVAQSPSEWGDDDILYVLSRRGLDMPGNLILGDASMSRLQKMVLDRDVVPEPGVLSHYTEQVEAIKLAGEESTALKPFTVVGGAQPKFTALREFNGKPEHVIVKYSKTSGNNVYRRWSDLLICEHLALTMANEHLGVKAAESRVLQDETNTYLEVTRFDRVGLNGRLPLCSWSTLNAGIIGTDDVQWPRAMKKLYDRDLMESCEIHKLILSWVYGKLIANSDMHNGNVSLMPVKGKLGIAPLYDMLPMAYAPLKDVMPNPAYTPVLRSMGLENLWETAAKAAGWFWLTASRDSRISDEFREICTRNLSALKAVVKG